jgi:2-polyprenyl-3-methyl-5-hydroxy-6-metoxy-1,4-benzoquinol methylase
MSAIYDLIGKKEYDLKMLHSIPPAPVVKRSEYILRKAKGKTVLDIGASGPMHEAIKQVTKRCYGIDISASNEVDHYQIDIDQSNELPDFTVDLVIAGEVIEHLDNAGHFLDLLKKYKCPVILTTPNAFCSSGYTSIQKGVEMVNPGHVAYYSYWTFIKLMTKHGYKLIKWFWYNGKPNTAEGMIFLMET